MTRLAKTHACCARVGRGFWRQPALGLNVPAETKLLTIESVRAVRCVDADTIREEVEEGKLRWVWDVSARGDGDVRELRFWTREVNAPEQAADLELADVINDLLGARKSWRGVEIEQLLLVSRATVHRFKEELNATVVKSVIHVQRPALATFFQRRLA